MAKAAANPFNADTDGDVETSVEEGQEQEAQYEFEQEPVTLADAAASAFGANLEGLSGSQEELDGTDYLKVKFVGMSMDSLEDSIELGDEFTFVVRARCVGEGTDLAKTDGHKRRFVKMDVSSVVIKDDTK